MSPSLTTSETKPVHIAFTTCLRSILISSSGRQLSCVQSFKMESCMNFLSLCAGCMSPRLVVNNYVTILPLYKTYAPLKTVTILSNIWKHLLFKPKHLLVSSSILLCTVLHSTVLCSTVLYFTVLYCPILYCAVQHCTIVYCAVQCFTVLYCTVLCSTALYCTLLTVLYCTVLCNTALYYSVLCSTVLYCTVLYYAVQHFTVL